MLHNSLILVATAVAFFISVNLPFPLPLLLICVSSTCSYLHSDFLLFKLLLNIGLKCKMDTHRTKKKTCKYLKRVLLFRVLAVGVKLAIPCHHLSSTKSHLQTLEHFPSYPWDLSSCGTTNCLFQRHTTRAHMVICKRGCLFRVSARVHYPFLLYSMDHWVYKSSDLFTRVRINLLARLFTSTTSRRQCLINNTRFECPRKQP